MLLLFATCAAAIQTDAAAQLLKKADAIKIHDPVQFAAILERLGDQPGLAPAELEYLHYLQGWKSAYDGEDATAISRLEALISDSRDNTLRFRARATLVNLLVLEKHYEAAFSDLGRMLESLPRVTDGDAREQGLLVAAELYTQVGEYDLALSYTQTLIEENWAGRGACKGGQLRMHALYDSHKLSSLESALQPGLDACVGAGEPEYANEIRTYWAMLLLDQGRFDDTIDLLKGHYDEMKYSRQIAWFDALLARAYEHTRDAVEARRFALHAVASSVKNEYEGSVVTAYLVLSEVAQEQGDFKSALAFYQQYAAADKGYLDDISARHLAYYKVTHENIANKLQVEALNKQNHVLQLQKALNGKEAETGRLYIAMLILTLVFIALWAYRTKRSQLHFMSLSQLDGLTGICNRPYFIQQAEKALEYGKKVGQEACLVLCDLDYFKSINDRYGHATGDFVLRRTVLACKMHLRKSDIFGRFGGEEFAILLPGCGLEEARRHSEALRVTIAAIVAYQGQGATQETISASFGVTATTVSGYELRHLLAHADAALYQAKRSGRNRVVVFEATESADLPHQAGITS